MKKEKGITLVSLVVTIIILIILAGISLNMVIGKNGLITKAQEAKENILLAQEEESRGLNQLYSQLNNIEGSIGGEGDSETIDKLLNFKKVIATAITKEGVTTQETDSAEIMANNIGKILQERTKDATATPDNISTGKTAWVNGLKITGNGKDIEDNKNVTIELTFNGSIYNRNGFVWQDVTGLPITITLSGNQASAISGWLQGSISCSVK